MLDEGCWDTLITRRSQVQILSPQPNAKACNRKIAGLSFSPTSSVRFDRRLGAHASFNEAREAIERHVEHRRHVQRQELREHEAADDRDTERLARLGAGAVADRYR